jgi:hypothetical protein
MTTVGATTKGGVNGGGCSVGESAAEVLVGTNNGIGSGVGPKPRVEVQANSGIKITSQIIRFNAISIGVYF